MEILRLDLAECDKARGIAIVVDVIRAFTTAAIAFECGARRIMFVGDSEQAFDLKRADPTLLIMGEEGGLPPPGYDFGNSPSELAGRDLTGRTLVHRSSNGTQGLVRCMHCEAIYASSFLTAAATAREISGAQVVSIINTGARPGRISDEDVACGDYLEAVLRGRQPAAEPYLARVDNCEAAGYFKDPGRPSFPAEDVALCMALDRCDFAIHVCRDGDRLVASLDAGSS